MRLFTITFILFFSCWEFLVRGQEQDCPQVLHKTFFDLECQSFNGPPCNTECEDANLKLCEVLNCQGAPKCACTADRNNPVFKYEGENITAMGQSCEDLEGLNLGSLCELCVSGVDVADYCPDTCSRCVIAAGQNNPFFRYEEQSCEDLANNYNPGKLAKLCNSDEDVKEDVAKYCGGTCFWRNNIHQGRHTGRQRKTRRVFKKD